MPTVASQSRSIAVGSVALIGSQMATVLGQVLYAGWTSRILLPEAFGYFAVALAAMGLMTLVLTAGLPSAVLTIPALTRAEANLLVVGSIVTGVLAAGVLWLGAPLWAMAWGNNGASDLTRTLALVALITVPGTVQLALLRREGRPLSDALIQAVSVLSGLAVGAIAVWTWREPWTLVVSPVVASAVVLLASVPARRIRYGTAAPTDWRRPVRYAANISGQSLVFWTLTSAPLWVVGLIGNAAELGQYSRALALATLPSGALSAALVRGLQPFYRTLERGPSTENAIIDVAVVAVALAVPVFGTMAIRGHDIILIWLGPVWDIAGSLAGPLAVGATLYVIFTTLANAVESLGMFATMRRIQTSMVVVLCGVVAVTLVNARVSTASWITAVIAITGIVAVMTQLTRTGVVASARRWLPVVRQLLWSASAVAVAGLAGSLCRLTPFWTQYTSLTRSAVVILVSTIVIVALTVLLLRRQPVWEVARRREIVRGTR